MRASATTRIVASPSPLPPLRRFTLDRKNFITALRLFVGEPVWTPYNRKDAEVDSMPARVEYVQVLKE